MNKRLLIAIIICVILGGGLVSYRNYRLQEANRIITYTIKPTYTNTPAVSPDASNPDAAVQTYYNWYYNCETDHFKHPSGSISEDCPYNKIGLLTSLFNAQLNQKGNSVFCAANTPAKLSYEKAVITGGHATAIVHTHWEASPTDTIKVALTKQNNAWRINDIICSRP